MEQERFVDIAKEQSLENELKEIIGAEAWLPLDKKRFQAEKPASKRELQKEQQELRKRALDEALRKRIIKKNVKRLKSTEKAEAADLRDAQSESSEEDTPANTEEDMKIQNLDKALDDHLHEIDCGSYVPADSFLGWGENVFGLQKKFPNFVMTSAKKDTVSRALRVNLSSGPDSTFALEGLVLRGLIPPRIALDGLSGAILSQWMFHQLTYSNNRALREATCKLFCSLLRPIQDGKRSYIPEWHLTYEHIMTVLENFGYIPVSNEGAGCDGKSGENPSDNRGPDGNARERSLSEDAAGVGVSGEVAAHLHDEGTVPEGKLDGDGSRDRPIELNQSEIPSLERGSVSEASMEPRAQGPPSNFRSFLRFLIAYVNAQKSTDAFQMPEVENLVVTLFRIGLDRRTMGVADLLQSSIKALVSCFKDAEWPSICERIAISLSKVGTTLQNNMRIAINGPENPRFVELRRRVVLLHLSSLQDLKTGISNSADVVSLFENFNLKEKTCNFRKLYNMLVLADTYLWSCDSFKQGVASDYKLWWQLINSCAQLKINYDEPDTITVRQWASLKTKNYEDEAKSRPEELNWNTDSHEERQAKDDSEIDDL